MFRMICGSILVVLLTAAAPGAARPESSPDKGSVRERLVAIADWVSRTQNLPQADDVPKVEFVATETLAVMRYRALLRSPPRTVSGERRSQAIGGEHATPLPRFIREVVALYDDEQRTIYLADGWTGGSLADESVLVHEMTHHLQNSARLKFACAGAREKPAYLAQQKWLEAHASDLEQEFQIDMFTVVAMSACMD